MDITIKSIIGFLDSKEKIRIVKKGEVVYSGLVKDLLKDFRPLASRRCQWS